MQKIPKPSTIKFLRLFYKAQYNGKQQSFKDNKRTTAQANDYNKVTSVCRAKFFITVSVTWVLMYIVIPVQ